MLNNIIHWLWFGWRAGQVIGCRLGVQLVIAMLSVAHELNSESLPLSLSLSLSLCAARARVCVCVCVCVCVLHRRTRRRCQVQRGDRRKVMHPPCPAITPHTKAYTNVQRVYQ